VPKSGLSIPRNAGVGKLIHARGNTDGNRSKPAGQSSERHRSAGNAPAMRNVVRISASLGELRLNVHKATNGLAHGSETAGSVRRASTVWSNAKASVNAATSLNQGSGTNADAGLATSSAASSASASATTAGTVSASDSGKGNGNGNGATGNGKGNGNHGNGNNGNGNGGNGKH
jgi:hypothetical protein